jgi:hypothetical protein
VKAIWQSEAFRSELPGWTLRGGLCAASSAGWAWLMGFQTLAELAGMLAGVAFWVVVFAAACARMSPSFARPPTEACTALKWAAWIKIAFTAAGWLVYAAASSARLQDLSQIAMLGTVDLLLGLVALWTVSVVSGMSDPGQVASADSFGWTMLTTVMEGALIATLIIGIALVVWILRRMLPAVHANENFPPVRVTDREVVQPPGPACS